MMPYLGRRTLCVVWPSLRRGIGATRAAVVASVSVAWAAPPPVYKTAHGAHVLVLPAIADWPKIHCGDRRLKCILRCGLRLLSRRLHQKSRCFHHPVASLKGVVIPMQLPEFRLPINTVPQQLKTSIQRQLPCPSLRKVRWIAYFGAAFSRVYAGFQSAVQIWRAHDEPCGSCPSPACQARPERLLRCCLRVLPYPFNPGESERHFMAPRIKVSSTSRKNSAPKKLPKSGSALPHEDLSKGLSCGNWGQHCTPLGIQRALRIRSRRCNGGSSVSPPTYGHVTKHYPIILSALGNSCNAQLLKS